MKECYFFSFPITAQISFSVLTDPICWQVSQIKSFLSGSCCFIHTDAYKDIIHEYIIGPQRCFKKLGGVFWFEEEYHAL